MNVIEMISSVGRDGSDKAGFSNHHNGTAAIGMSYGHRDLESECHAKPLQASGTFRS